MRFCVLASAVCFLASPASADPLWVRTYNGPDVYHDYVSGIGVDDSGNAVVTGCCRVDYTGREFVTIKYRPDGDTAWVRHFDPDSGVDAASALAVDRTGNVIVTGYRTRPSYWDWATIKYSPTGESLWAVFHTPADFNRALSVAVDSAGNSYVAGFASYDRLSWAEVVKYDPTGNRVWTYGYALIDAASANAVAVDRQGYCYVTGWTAPHDGIWAIMTCKIGLDGHGLWVNIYDGPPGEQAQGRAIAVDDSGNVVVVSPAEGSAGFEDYLTLKVGPDGDTLWTRHYDGPSGLDDAVRRVALDAAGGVYVTGKSYIDTAHFSCATVKYSPEGEERWVAHYAGSRGKASGHAIAVDGYCNVYVTGNTLNRSDTWDVFIIKYDSAGNQVWLDRYDRPGAVEDAYLIALGPDRSVFVGGSTLDEGQGWDYMTLKYAPVGGVVGITPQANRFWSSPTIVRGVLSYQPAAGSAEPSAALLDLSGRKVIELRPGENDIRHVAPGVYFVRREKDNSTTKVVVQK